MVVHKMTFSEKVERLKEAIELYEKRNNMMTSYEWDEFERWIYSLMDLALAIKKDSETK